jgi:hypothetical protein
MPDRGTAPALVRDDDIAQIFGVHPGGERGRSDEIAKHHGQLAALGLRRRGGRGRRDQSRRQGDRRRDRCECRRRRVARLGEGRADKRQPLSAVVDRQALADQFVTDVLDGLLVEPEFLAQPPIADPPLQAQQARDEGQGLRECRSGVHPLALRG